MAPVNLYCHMQYFSTHGNRDGKCGNIKLRILDPHRDDVTDVLWDECFVVPTFASSTFVVAVDRPGQNSLAVGLGLVCPPAPRSETVGKQVVVKGQMILGIFIPISGVS